MNSQFTQENFVNILQNYGTKWNVHQTYKHDKVNFIS